MGFGRGWTRRLATLMAAGVGLAAMIAAALGGQADPAGQAVTRIDSGSPVLPGAGIDIATAPLRFALPETQRVASFMDCIRGRAPLVSAHRGGPRPGYPENALETFTANLKLAPLWFEADVRESADGVLLLLHDSTLERTTTGRGRVDEMAWEALAELRLKDNDGRETDFRIPRLSEALAWAEDRTVLQLDVKRGVSHAKVVRAVADAGAFDHTVIITYSAEDAVAAYETDPRVTLSVGLDDAAALDALAAAGVPADRVLAWTGTRDPDPVAWAGLRTAGVSVSFGTLFGLDDEIIGSNQTQRYSQFAADGVDLLASDYPLEAFAAIEGRFPVDNGLATCLPAPAG